MFERSNYISSTNLFIYSPTTSVRKIDMNTVTGMCCKIWVYQLQSKWCKIDYIFLSLDLIFAPPQSFPLHVFNLLSWIFTSRRVPISFKTYVVLVELHQTFHLIQVIFYHCVKFLHHYLQMHLALLFYIHNYKD